MCPAAVNTKTQVKGFVDIAVKAIAARFNSGAPGVNLTAQDAYAIMHLCPFDTVAKEVISPFCSLFSEEDFEIYEYAGDLEKFYNTGYILQSSHNRDTSLTVSLLVMELHWEPFKASDTSTNSSGASKILPYTTACKPTSLYFHLPRPSH
jgi:hypothetical protein